MKLPLEKSCEHDFLSLSSFMAELEKNIDKRSVNG